MGGKGLFQNTSMIIVLPVILDGCPDGDLVFDAHEETSRREPCVTCLAFHLSKLYQNLIDKFASRLGSPALSPTNEGTSHFHVGTIFLSNAYDVNWSLSDSVGGAVHHSRTRYLEKTHTESFHLP